jgi:hypothetical protein
MSNKTAIINIVLDPAKNEASKPASTAQNLLVLTLPDLAMLLKCVNEGLIPKDRKCLLWIHACQLEHNSKRTSGNSSQNHIRSGQEVATSVFNLFGDNVPFSFFTSGEIADTITFGTGHSKMAVLIADIFDKNKNQDYLESFSFPSNLLFNTEPISTLQNTSFSDNSDWRNKALEQIISKQELQTIFEKIFLDGTANFSISVIEPGLSGAFVLKVTQTVPLHSPDNFLFKFSKKPLNEKESAKKMASLDFPSTVFITAIPRDSYSPIQNWHVLHYIFVDNSTTLKDYILKEIGKKTEQELIALFDQIFKNYERHSEATDKSEKWKINNITSKTWDGSGSYEGLKMRDPSSVKKSIYDVFSLFGKEYLNDTIFLDLEDDSIHDKISIAIHRLFQLLDGNGTFGRKDVTIPISHIHGDFNAGNILVNATDGTNPRFIDFSAFPEKPNQHALMDYGKLSVDVERRLVHDQYLFDNSIKLDDWCTVHKNWLNHKDLGTENEILKKIYAINSFIRERTLVGWPNPIQNKINEEDGVYKKELENQFQMIRLHYFLRTITHPNFTPQKKLFAIRACLDIMKYLTV